MPNTSDSQPKKLRLDLPRGGSPLVFKKDLERVLQSLARHLGVAISIDGASSGSTGIDGTHHFKVPTGGGADCVYAWQPTLAGTSGTNDLVTLEVGSLSGATVTIGGTDILDNPPPQLSISQTGTQIAYLEVTGTKTKTANDFVTGFTISGATIQVGTSVPASSQTVRRLELFRWYDGAVFSQLTKFNLALACRDDGNSNDVGVFTFY